MFWRSARKTEGINTIPTAVPNAFDLTGQVALVTGSSSELGIGFASARLLGQFGASVMVTGTTERAAERALELQSEGIAARSHVADLMDPDAARALVEATEAVFGRLDIVVNNAGLASVHIPERPNPLMVMSDGEWRLALRRNVDSAFFVTRAALPGMVERGYGRIVNVASTAGILTAYTGDVGYHTAKAAMLGMTRSVAVDYARNGVTANRDPGLDRHRGTTSVGSDRGQRHADRAVGHRGRGRRRHRVPCGTGRLLRHGHHAGHRRRQSIAGATAAES